MIYRIALLLACLAISACQSTWSLVSDENKSIRLGQLKVDAPLNWVIYNEHFNNYGGSANAKFVDNSLQRIMLSKNGFELDIIDIVRFDVTHAFPTINRAVTENTLPLELAELYIAEQKTLTGIDIFTITRNEPSKISNHDSFLVQYHYRNSEGLYVEQMSYGFVDGHYFYSFTFRAPSLHFFDAGIKDFIRMLDSIALTN